MTYIMSDIHGEYKLFCSMLKRIGFSENDRMYICGDIIDKGPESVRLAKLIFSYPNIRCIMGNHEDAFLQYYRSLMDEHGGNFEAALKALCEYFPDGALLSRDIIDRIASLPYYIETDEFICVHAGIPINEDGRLTSLAAVPPKVLLHDRRFKERDVRHNSPKCVFFGHTETNCIIDRPRVIAYLRNNAAPPYKISDFYKIHLDTGAWNSGVLACFCIERAKTYYVRRERGI